MKEINDCQLKKVKKKVNNAIIKNIKKKFTNESNLDIQI